MMNDEQILLKTTQLLENFDISTKKPENLLREMDEVELEALAEILDGMKGEDLAFNKLFDGKLRKVIDFPTFNSSSELGQFRDFFKSQEYDVDWEKGLVSAERDIRTSDDLINTLIGMQGGRPEKKKTKKFQMKIGKLFAKLINLVQTKAEIVKNDPEFQKNEDYKRTLIQIRLYIPNAGVAGPAGYDLGDLATKYSEYWKTHAGYIKKEINKLDNEKYSIIITRHPIDVMRMSDFKKITSCHSPPSRSGGTNEYYKCAVAEAMGHGALAYVVETEDLLYETNTSNIESAEQEIQKGEILDEVYAKDFEIFWDDGRPDSTSGVSLKPISRVRLRQFRYYDTDTPKLWDDGTELAVPEKAIYGEGIPGIADRVVKWAGENQKETIRDMPETDEMVNLDRFWIFGGSYEDTSGAPGRRQLLSALTGIDEMHFTGDIRQNKETEDALDANAISGLIGRYRSEIEQLEHDWNQRYTAVGVRGYVNGNDEGGVYIEVEARITFTYDLDEFSSLPNSYPTGMHAFDSINDMWGDIFDAKSGFVNKFSNTTVHVGCDFNLQHPDISDTAYIYDPDGFKEFCIAIGRLDNRRDEFKAHIDQFLKQEGYLQGGEYIKLAMEIEDGDITSYEWDLETDGNYSDSYESYASISFNYDPEQWKTDPQALLGILQSREYRALLRSNLLAAPRAEVNTEYYLDVAYASATESGGDIRYTIQFKIDADDPDERVGLFRDMVEGDMDDEDNLRAVFEKTLSEIRGTAVVDPAGEISEQLVGTWKRFLGR